MQPYGSLPTLQKSWFDIILSQFNPVSIFTATLKLLTWKNQISDPSFQMNHFWNNSVQVTY